MLGLLSKDFKIIFAKQGSKKQRILATLSEIILLVLFVGLETFIFTALLNKIKSFNNGPSALLTIFLACISLGMIVLNTLRANKLFFNQKDILQLTQHPISNESIIVSKLVLMFLMHYLTSIVFIYPLFISYGLIISKSMWFYYIVIFYPFISFLFEGGMSLLLVYPFKLLKDVLAKHIVVEFVSSIVLMAVLGTGYGLVLRVFTNLVSDNNINLLFTVENINRIQAFSKYIVPINFLIELFVNSTSNSFLPLITISLGIFLVGLIVSIVAYNYFRNYVVYGLANKKEHKVKLLSVKKQLLKKEFMLLFKNQNYIFSFTGLLFIQPLLMYLVVSSVNTIFNNGTYLYYLKVVPAFLPLMDILLILLFTVLVSSGANSYIRSEEKTMKIIKSIPVNYKTQIGIKVIIPFLFSLSSLVISLIVLVSTGAIRWDTFLISSLFSILLLMSFDGVSLLKELSLHQSSTLTNLVAYVLPIVLTATSIGLSFIKLNLYIIYAINFGVYLVLTLVLVLYIHKNLNDKFMDLEVVN